MLAYLIMLTRLITLLGGLWFHHVHHIVCPSLCRVPMALYVLLRQIFLSQKTLCMLFTNPHYILTNKKLYFRSYRVLSKDTKPASLILRHFNAGIIQGSVGDHLHVFHIDSLDLRREFMLFEFTFSIAFILDVTYN